MQKSSTKYWQAQSSSSYRGYSLWPSGACSKEQTWLIYTNQSMQCSISVEWKAELCDHLSGCRKMPKRHLIKFNFLSWWKLWTNLSREETCLNLIMAICNKAAANVILMGGITESFFSKFWNKTRHLAILLFNIVLKF